MVPACARSALGAVLNYADLVRDVGPDPTGAVSAAAADVRAAADGVWAAFERDWMSDDHRRRADRRLEWLDVEEYTSAAEADWEALNGSAVAPPVWVGFGAALDAVGAALGPPLGRLLGLARRLAAVSAPAPSDRNSSDPAYVGGTLGPLVERFIASPDAAPFRGLLPRLDANDPMPSARRLHEAILDLLARSPPEAPAGSAAQVAPPAPIRSVPPAAPVGRVRPLAVHQLAAGEDWAEFDRLKKEIDPGDRYVGQSVAILRLFRRIELLNQRPDAPVVIVGPSGVGKTALAELVHSSSARKKREWLHISADTVKGGNDSIRRSQFVGFGKDSGISGVEKNPPPSGWLRDCAGGTLFVDEMHDLDEATAGLLRQVFDKSPMKPEGGNSPAFTPDVRLVFATFKTEAELKAAGRLPVDFLRRLQGRYVAVPLIEDRQEDVPLFVRAHAGGREADTSFLLALMRSDWEAQTFGLIEAIHGAVDRLAANCRRKLTAEDLRGGLVPDEVIESVTGSGEAERDVYEYLRQVLGAQGYRRGSNDRPLQNRLAMLLNVHKSTVSRVLNTLVRCESRDAEAAPAGSGAPAD